MLRVDLAEWLERRHLLRACTTLVTGHVESHGGRWRQRKKIGGWSGRIFFLSVIYLFESATIRGFHMSNARRQDRQLVEPWNA